MTAAASDDDHLLAADVAAAAGRLLVALRAEQEAAGVPQGARRDAADAQAHAFIVRALAETRPDDAVLSEEGVDDPRRLDAERVWVVDPLDGTREYGEVGRWDWAVHVALVVDGVPVAGAVALPAEELVLATPDPLAALPAARAGAPAGPVRMVVSRSRPPAVTGSLQRALGAELVPLGSAGAKAMAVVRGHADVYAHAGGQYEWDSAAPVAVAAAAGLHTSRLDGAPLSYNRADPWLPDLLVCRPQLVDQVLAAVHAHRPGRKGAT